MHDFISFHPLIDPFHPPVQGLQCFSSCLLKARRPQSSLFFEVTMIKYYSFLHGFVFMLSRSIELCGHLVCRAISHFSQVEAWTLTESLQRVNTFLFLFRSAAMLQPTCQTHGFTFDSWILWFTEFMVPWSCICKTGLNHHPSSPMLDS